MENQNCILDDKDNVIHKRKYFDSRVGRAITSQQIKMITIVFHHQNQVLLTKHLELLQGEITDRDAYSASHAAARYMLTNFPSLRIIFKQQYLDIVDWSAEQVLDGELSENPWLYVWSHYFNDAPIWDIQNDFIYFIELTVTELDRFLEQGLTLQYLNDAQIPQPTQDIINKLELQQLLQSKVYLNLETDYVYLSFKEPGLERFKAPRPFLDTYTIYNGIFRRKGQRWTPYKVTRDEYPSCETLANCKVIVMPGSGASAYDQKEWISQLQKFIFSTYHNYPNIKFLGICFGMQITTKTFGGEVKPLEGRRANRNFYLSGNAQINFNERALQLFPNLPQQMLINKAHGDQVSVFPDMFERLASSDLCENEILISKDKRILMMQSHPEFSSTYQKIFLTRMTAINKNQPIHEIMKNQEFTAKWTHIADSIGRDLCFEFISQT